MKSNIRLLIIMLAIILGIIMSIIAFAMSTVVNKDAIMEKNEDTIISNYSSLTIATSEELDLRKQISDKLKTFDSKTYVNEHETYIALLTDYNEKITKITEYVKNIEPRCKKEYEEARVNVICMSYSRLYEDAINAYVKNLNDYNTKIETYNQTSDKKYDKYRMLHAEYVDYDKDGVYSGVAVAQ